MKLIHHLYVWYVECLVCGMFGLCDARDVRYSRCETFGMWDVWDVRCPRYVMSGMWNVQDLGCWDVWDVGFLEYRMWHVGCLLGCGMLFYKILFTHSSGSFGIVLIRFLIATGSCFPGIKSLLHAWKITCSAGFFILMGNMAVWPSLCQTYNRNNSHAPQNLLLHCDLSTSLESNCTLKSIFYFLQKLILIVSKKNFSKKKFWE